MRNHFFALPPTFCQPIQQPPVGFRALPYNGGIRPLLKFDGIANSAEPRAFNLNFG